MTNTQPTFFRRYKDGCNGLLVPFGVKVETSGWWEGRNKNGYYEGIVLELSMLRDITFADLEEISALFGTKDINFSPSENGYYGDFEHSKLTVTIQETQADKWFYTAEETMEQDAKEKAKQEQQERDRLLCEAKRHGYKLVKETK